MMMAFYLLTILTQTFFPHTGGIPHFSPSPPFSIEAEEAKLMPRVMSFISCREWMGRIEPGSIFGGISFFSFSRMSDDCLEKNRVLCSVQRQKRGENNGSKIFTFSFLCRNSRRLRASDLGGAHFPDFFFHARHFFIIVSRHGFCACVSTQTATLSPPSRVQLAFSKNSLQRQKLETHFLKKIV